MVDEGQPGAMDASVQSNQVVDKSQLAKVFYTFCTYYFACIVGMCLQYPQAFSGNTR